MPFRLAVLDWLPGYSRRDLPRDLFAGLMGTLSTVPEAMAYAILAGLPSQAGLYALFAPLLAYFLLGTSRDLALAPTATISALLALTVGRVTAGDPAHFAALCALAAWLLGAALLAAGLLRLGYLAHLVSRPVVDGYFTGAAVVIAAGQIALLLGVQTDGLDLPTIARALATAPQWQRSSALLGAALLGLLFASRAIGQERFGPALALVAGTLAVHVFRLDVDVIGTLESGLPPLALPSFERGEVRRMLGGVLATSLLVFLESASFARHYADRNGYRLDLDQELRALGVANLLSGATRALPVSGNLGDTILLERAGARTQIVSLVTAALVLLVLLFGADLPNVPIASFAAIIVFAVLRPNHVRPLARARAFDPAEFWLGICCIAGVLWLGLLQGLLLAIGITVLVLLARVAHPTVPEVGYLAGPAPALVLRTERSEAARLPGKRIFQPVGALFFASASAVTEALRQQIDAAEAPELVALDVRLVPFVDFTACLALAQLRHDLEARGVRFVVTRARTRVAAQLARCDPDRAWLLEGDLPALLAVLGLPPDVRDRT